MLGLQRVMRLIVSTHSRLKAAEGDGGGKGDGKGFNTQPPKGGWPSVCFGRQKGNVSTHSRLKAAGGLPLPNASAYWFQHTAA